MKQKIKHVRTIEMADIQPRLADKQIEAIVQGVSVHEQRFGGLRRIMIKMDESQDRGEHIDAT
ncbi:MAG: hypothetical protein PHP61_02045 [Candidatus Izemoplasmatales bacterium]|nr:hypothetical protein [Candidatus Izemoplasmatales bacterium]